MSNFGQGLAGLKVTGGDVHSTECNSSCYNAKIKFTVMLKLQRLCKMSLSGA